MEQERLPRKRGKVGGALTERDEMRKSLGEQETIILGYQKVSWLSEFCELAYFQGG